VIQQNDCLIYLFVTPYM